MPFGDQADPPFPSSTLPSSPPIQKKPTRKLFGKGIAVPLVVAGFVGTLSFVLFKTGIPVPRFPAKLSSWLPKDGQPKVQSKQTSSKAKPSKPLESFLSTEERAELVKPLQITIPRQLTQDEEEVLKKQVSFPAQLAEKPTLAMWKKEDFEKMLAAEQQKRKVRLGWSYERSVIKTFEKSYPAAVQAFENGDYVLARELFMRTLSFPVYRNNPARHRAIALVMLRPYINDVIGKIAVLNQYMLKQSLSTQVHTLFNSYQALFPILELQEWDRAFQLITELKGQISTFESQSQSATVDYPPTFSGLDLELQNAIRTEAAPKPEAAVSLKTLTIDLNLKEAVVRQNRGEELVKVQKQCEEIASLLQQKNWQLARDRLRSIEFPPELVNEARKKIALVEKMFAIQEAEASKR